MKPYIILLLLIFSSTLLFSQKDSIKLINKDIIIGEIKKMDRNVLTFKTPYSDSDFKIEWHKVIEIYSDRTFIVSIEDGERYTTTINSDIEDKGKVIIYIEGQEFKSEIIDVVFLEPIGKSFLSRLVIDMDFGVTLTKANNLRQFNANISYSLISNHWSTDGFFKSVFSRQDGIADISRIDGKIAGQYFLPHDWFVSISGTYLANNEQLLDLRSTYKGGLGYFVIRSNSMYLGTSGGLAWTNEAYIDDTPTKSSSEAYVGVDYNKYGIGDLSLLTSFIVFPSLTESGRVRADFNFDMKYDLPLDFYIKMSTTYNYDNQPIEGASKGDYVFTTSFGWELN